MYNIGDKVVYPIHGAGIIETIEEKEVLGEKNKYYVLRIPLGNMRVMIPIDNTGSHGIRRVVSLSQAERVLSVLSDKASEMNRNWNHRYRENEGKIKEGNILDIAEIVRNLTVVNNAKKLSPGEKKILANASHMLKSELMLVFNADESEIDKLLGRLIKSQPESE